MSEFEDKLDEAIGAQQRKIEANKVRLLLVALGSSGELMLGTAGGGARDGAGAFEDDSRASECSSG